jgi:hypothetical protein
MRPGYQGCQGRPFRLASSSFSATSRPRCVLGRIAIALSGAGRQIAPTRGSVRMARRRPSSERLCISANAEKVVAGRHQPPGEITLATRTKWPGGIRRMWSAWRLYWLTVMFPGTSLRTRLHRQSAPRAAFNAPPAMRLARRGIGRIREEIRHVYP